mgnify:CR=1 FL=1
MDEEIEIKRAKEKQEMVPITYPIKSLDELNEWQPNDFFNISYVPLHQRPGPKPKNQVLVCHDMMGGYLNDR